MLYGGERGLLGLAFHPKFSSNRRFYVNYTRQRDGATVVAEYRDGAEQRILFTVPQPYENHNGGMIEFGPDGFFMSVWATAAPATIHKIARRTPTSSSAKCSASMWTFRTVRRKSLRRVFEIPGGFLSIA